MNSTGIYSKFSYLYLFIFFYLSSPAQNYNWISTWQPGGTLDFHSSITDGQGNTYTSYYSWNESTQINKLAVVKQIGVYSTDIKFETFSSGIYYYKLFAGSFSEIRKMVLLK